MIVLTTACRSILAAPAAAADWPGPFCLVLLPDTAMPAAAAPDYLFDLRPAAVSALALLREVILKVVAGPLPWPGPVLLLDDDRPPADLVRLRQEAEADPRTIRAEADASGRTRLLLFGAAVAAHPLFPTHFRNMTDEIPEDQIGPSLDIARRHLLV